MIDLHCHLLPGVDDGSRTVERSVKVLTAMQQGGVTAVCLTPHLTARQAPGGIPPEHDEAFRRLSELAPPGIELRRGVELMLDRPVAAAVATDRRLCLGGSRFLLVEFSRMVTVSAAAAALQQVRQHGAVPVLAHPERYSACTAHTAAQWKQCGAVLQVDATTLFLPSTRGHRARELVEHGLADILAADNHGDERSVVAPYQRLEAAGGQMQADLLLKTNPAAILANGELTPVPGFTIKTSWIARIRHLFQADE